MEVTICDLKLNHDLNEGDNDQKRGKGSICSHRKNHW